MGNGHLVSGPSTDRAKLIITPCCSDLFAGGVAAARLFVNSVGSCYEVAGIPVCFVCCYTVLQIAMVDSGRYIDCRGIAVMCESVMEQEIV